MLAIDEAECEAFAFSRHLIVQADVFVAAVGNFCHFEYEQTARIICLKDELRQASQLSQGL